MPKNYIVKRAKAKTKVDKRQDRQIKKIIRDYQPELKTTFLEYPADSIPAVHNNAMQLLILTQVPQGVNQQDRVGDAIKLQRLKFQMMIHLRNTTTPWNYVRILIVHDKGFDGVNYPLIQNILDGTSFTDGHNKNFMANYDINYVNVRGSRGKQYTILADRKIQFGKLDTTATETWANGPLHKMVTINKRFKVPKKVYYDGIGGTDSRAGTIFAIILPGNDSTDTSNPAIYLHCQIYYTDA